MHTAVTRRTGRAHVLAATDHHPFALVATATEGEVQALLGDRVTGWFTPGHRPSFSALGEPAAAAALLAQLSEAGELVGVPRVHLPRIGGGDLAHLAPIGEPDHWDFLWSRAAPSRQPEQERVVRLDPADEPAVAALLAEAFPGSFTRPGDPRVRTWYGIWEARELIACGADRSRGGAGSLAGLAVHPDRRGRGLGAALTAAIATALSQEFPVVTLGVLIGNQPAAHLYHRLGFTQATARTSVDLREPQ